MPMLFKFRGETLELNPTRFGSSYEMKVNGKRVATMPAFSAMAMRFDLVQKGWQTLF